jgi:hypothetical protein
MFTKMINLVGCLVGSVLPKERKKANDPRETGVAVGDLVIGLAAAYRNGQKMPDCFAPFKEETT